MVRLKLFLTAMLFAILLMTSNISQAASYSDAMRLGILPVTKAAAVSADLQLDDTEIATGAIYDGLSICDDFNLLSRTDVDKFKNMNLQHKV